MRRKALIATLLLPLPFAALPLVGVLFGMSGGPGTVIVDARRVEDRPMQFDTGPAQPDPVLYGIQGPFQGGCDGHPELRAES